MILTMCRGHVLWPAHRKAALDLIPVDLVAAGTIAATAVLLSGRQERVYHLASSDANPVTVRRCGRTSGSIVARSTRTTPPRMVGALGMDARGSLHGIGARLPPFRGARFPQGGRAPLEDVRQAAANTQGLSAS